MTNFLIILVWFIVFSFYLLVCKLLDKEEEILKLKNERKID